MADGAVEKEQEKKYVILRQSADEAEVAKLVRKDGKWVEDARHQVKGHVCDCKGFAFRGKCSHVALVYDPQAFRDVELWEAREIVAEGLQLLGPVGVRLPAEPYEKAPSGLVTRVNLLGPGKQRLMVETHIRGVRLRIHLEPEVKP